ncbi:MAG: alanine--glyoxylate aminotransferase family protein [Limnochordia bacterium]
MSSKRKLPERILMGPGPSGVHPRVLQAMAMPLTGHLDPVFLEIMDEVKGLLQMVFGTENELTAPMSGTGSAGMETVFVNLVEPGDKVIVCVKGLFGQRMVDMGRRCGAEAVQVDGAWGDVIYPEQVEAALRQHPDAKLVSIVQAETSTGVLQPLGEISGLVHDAGALLVVDAVTSLGGTHVDVDKNGIDACFSGTQKCLSVPPGLAPVTMNSRAEEVLLNRKSPVQSWYLDLSMIRNYWGQERFYHHTAPISMIFALREALEMLAEEGLENAIKRHQELGAVLQAGLEEMGLELVVAPQHRLPQLTVVRIPEGVSDAQVRGRLLNEYGIEIGGGLGEFKGKVWRIGLMGSSCKLRNVTLVLSALREILDSI